MCAKTILTYILVPNAYYVEGRMSNVTKPLSVSQTCTLTQCRVSSWQDRGTWGVRCAHHDSPVIGLQNHSPLHELAGVMVVGRDRGRGRGRGRVKGRATTHFDFPYTIPKHPGPYRMHCQEFPYSHFPFPSIGSIPASAGSAQQLTYSRTMHNREPTPWSL